jgi:subtilisin family serine protease
MTRVRALALAASLAASAGLAVVSPVGAQNARGASNPNTDAVQPAPGVDTSSALVQLTSDPLSTSTRTRPPRGRKIDFSSQAVRAERARLAAERNAFKSWLRNNAPRARVTSEYDISLNAVAVALNGTPLTTIAGAPGVRAAEYQETFRPTDDNDPDLSIIHAQQAWEQGGAAGAGQGVKVAVIDSGIDITHPCFSDDGYPAQTQLGDHQFTNNKVIAAKVFINGNASKRLTAEAIGEHGTHVAGTVACNLDTPASVDGVSIPYGVSGVAPAALLGNYNIFPGTIGNARSEDIVNALEAAYADGFDVANMSLGGGSHGRADLLARAVDDLDQANMVVAVAAGNSGPGHFTVESPGKAVRALTAGASTVPHFIGTQFVWDSDSTGLAAGDFATVASDLTAPIAVIPGTIGGLGLACAALPGGSLAGSIAVLSRGECNFSLKISNAQAAGAAAVIVVNNVAGDPAGPGKDDTPNQPTIPAYMASLAERASLVAADGADGTISAVLSYVQSSNVDIMAGFSSQGPTDVDYRVKPDVVAPGVNVLSSVPHTECGAPPCWAFFQGTSMATPHLAGSAAVVRGQHPGWSAGEILSAIVNTADQNVLTEFQTGTATETDVNIVGAGRENLLRAVGASVGLDPVSASFGPVPGSSGQTRTAAVTVRNLSSVSATFAVAVDPMSGTGASVSPSPGSLTLAPGDAATVTLTLVTAPGAETGDRQAALRITSAGVEVAHAAVYTFVR